MKSPRASRGLLAGFVVVVLGLAVAIGVWFSIGENESASVRNHTNDSRRITDAQSAKASQFPSVSPSGTSFVISSNEGVGEDADLEAAGTTTNVVVATDANATTSKTTKVVFKNPMDQIFAMVAPQEAGGAVPPLPNFSDENFTPEQEQQMLEQLTADDDDSEAVLARKELVQAMRNEYSQLKAEHGWKFTDYIKALYAKVDLDNEVLRESCTLHEAVFNDPNISDAQYLETLGKINAVLEQRGIKPIPVFDEDDQPRAETATESNKGKTK